MFLDNIAHNRALVKMPWSQFKREGNSLFWWLMIFGLFSSVLVLGVLGGTGYWIYQIVDLENPFTSEVITAGSVGIGVFLLLLFVSLFIATLQNSVVIPQMYQHRIGVGEAWIRALRLFKSRFWGFTGYILWTIVLNLAAAIILMVVTLITCCIAGLLMAIPYLGAVLTLPVTVFFYALGPEFIRQFGEEYDIWAEDPDYYKMVPHAPGQ